MLFGGKDTPVDQHISNTQTICQLSARDENSIPGLNIYILWDMTYSIPNLVPTQFQKSIFTPITRLKISALLW